MKWPGACDAAHAPGPEISVRREKRVLLVDEIPNRQRSFQAIAMGVAVEVSKRPLGPLRGGLDAAVLGLRLPRLLLVRGRGAEVCTDRKRRRGGIGRGSHCLSGAADGRSRRRCASARARCNVEHRRTAGGFNVVPSSEPILPSILSRKLRRSCSRGSSWARSCAPLPCRPAARRLRMPYTPSASMYSFRTFRIASSTRTGPSSP